MSKLKRKTSARKPATPKPAPLDVAKAREDHAAKTAEAERLRAALMRLG